MTTPLRQKVCLSTIYGCGLRLQKGIHAYLGHASPRTTSLYTHLTPQVEASAVQAIKDVVGRLWP